MPRSLSVLAAALVLPAAIGPARAQETPRDPRVEEARRALAAGDLEHAHDLLTAVLVSERLERARKLLADGHPEDAMELLDEALDLDPHDPEVQIAFGRGSLAMAAAHGDALFYDDALAAFRRAGDDPRALAGASEAAYARFDFESAYDYAVRALAARDAASPPPALERAPERLAAQAAYQAYARAMSDGAPAETTDPLFARAEKELAAELARTPLDPWVHLTLSSLYAWSGNPFDARTALERGLDYVPGDETLWQRWSEQVYAAEDGALAAVSAFEHFTEKHPGVALGRWYLAQARFEVALQALDAGAPEDDDSAAAEHWAGCVRGFEDAEREFVRCRELEADYEDACRGYEAVCRDGAGWSLYHAGDLEAAQERFLSMNEVLPGGIEWALEGRLLDGIRGLAFVADAYSGRGELAAAAEVFDRLREIQPDEVDWNNNAGFFHRDAGSALEGEAELFERAAEGSIPDAEQRAEVLARAGLDPQGGDPEQQAAVLGSAAERLRAQAREHYEKSYAAYQVAARLAPDDVRIVNDCALVAVYHLGRDLEHAEAMLRRCVARGAELMEHKDEMDEDELYQLENAWGDAHQNLGVLYLRYKHDPKTARTWFEKSLAIGPDPRPECAAYIQQCDLQSRTP